MAGWLLKGQSYDIFDTGFFFFNKQLLLVLLEMFQDHLYFFDFWLSYRDSSLVLINTLQSLTEIDTHIHKKIMH